MSKSDPPALPDPPSPAHKKHYSRPPSPAFGQVFANFSLISNYTQECTRQASFSQLELDTRREVFEK